MAEFNMDKMVKSVAERVMEELRSNEVPAGFKTILDIKRDLIDEGAYEQEINGHTEYLKGIDFAIGVIKKHLNNVYGVNISDLYPETIFKRPCSNCTNEDSINICDQCCFRYDSWFKKKEGEKND